MAASLQRQAAMDRNAHKLARIAADHGNPAWVEADGAHVLVDWLDVTTKARGWDHHVVTTRAQLLALLGY